MSAFGAADAYELVEMLDGMRESASRKATTPPLPGAVDFDDQRLRHISSDFIVATPALRQIQHSIALARQRNAFANFGRGMVLLSGEAGTGKTTALVAAAQTCITESRRDHPDVRLPVLFIDAPAGATPKSVMMTLLRALRLAVPRAMTTPEMTDLVVAHTNEQGVQMIVVDELHNLSDNRRSTVDAANTLKVLSNQVRATFVYSGIGIDSGELLSGPHGNQISGRSVAHSLAPLVPTDKEGAAQWMGLIRAFETQLLLRDHPAGTLAPLGEYLLARTAGYIGALRQLLVDAAMSIITERRAALIGGTPNGRLERITKADLEKVRVDLRSERQASAAAKLRKPDSGGRAK